MKRNYTLLYIAGTAGFAALLFMGTLPNHVARAAAGSVSDTNFTLMDGDHGIVVSNSIVNSWMFPVRLPDRSVVARPATSWASLVSGLTSNTVAAAVHYRIYNYSPGKIYSWLRTDIAPTLDQEAQEPSLTISENQATDFTPPQTGKKTDLYASTQNIMKALEIGSSQAQLNVSITEPHTALGDLNSMGINELVGHGESNFKGSPKNRIHNIHVGVEKLKGLIIPQGAEFSFNKNICPVDKEGGYLPELVILGDKGTVPEYGGGLCQVSSTVFRATMNSGLPVTQRKNHSYAVQYYAPQGSDATTYCGAIDFKFKNDSPGAILVWPWFKDDHTLIFDFYGSKDGREITVDTPVQFDRKSDGSMKAYWNRTVVMPDGEVRKDNFKSNYLPPALFHKHEELTSTPGTTPPVAPGTTPSPTPSPSPTPTTPTPSPTP